MPTSHPAISDIRVFRFDIPLRRAMQIATMRLESAQNLLVRIQCSNGVVGWGEASPFHAITGETQGIDLAAAEELKPLLLGRDPFAIASVNADMMRFLPHTSTIRSAFDMALYDVASRTASLPLYRFLGGENRPLETDVTIYLGDPADAAAKARDLVREGFRVLKVKLGADPDTDRKKIEAIRKAVGEGTRLRVDANQAWDRVTALQVLRSLEKYSIEFCEQPCVASDHRTLAYLSDHSPIPIMADESLFSPQDALTLDRMDAVPYFNIKLSKSGGIEQARRIAAIAGAGGRRCMVGSMCESRLGITAAAHFALSSPVVAFCDLDTFCEQTEDPIRGGVAVRDGCLIVPDEPGIGAVPDESFLGAATER